LSIALSCVNAAGNKYLFREHYSIKKRVFALPYCFGKLIVTIEKKTQERYCKEGKNPLNFIDAYVGEYTRGKKHAVLISATRMNTTCAMRFTEKKTAKKSGSS
jgi:hypothetical protein